MSEPSESMPNMPSQPQPQQQPTPNQVPGRVWWVEASRRFSLIGAALAIMVVFWIGLNILAGNALLLLFPGGNMPTWAVFLASSGPLYAIAMPLSMLVFTRVPAIETRRYNMTAGEFLQLLVMCVPVMYLGNIIGNMFSQTATDGQAVDRVSSLLMGSQWWVTVLFAVILGPIFEEWIFRKEIISRLRRYGERTAIVISALAFALFHQNFFQFFYAFGLGLLFGYAYMRTSKLIYPVLMHMILNFNGSVIAPLLLRSVDSRILDGSLSQADLMRMIESGNLGGMGAMMLYSIVIFALLITGIVLLVKWQRRWEFYTAPEELPRGSKLRIAVGNPGMIVYILIAVALSVLMLFQ